MAIVIASHKVKDFSVWKPVFDADAKRRQEMGIKVVKEGHSANDPNHVFFIWEVDDPAKFAEAAKDPGLKATMEKAGVIGDLNVTLLNEF
jgi:hypothetical protein